MKRPVQAGVSDMYPTFCTVTARGLTDARQQARSSASACAASGYGFHLRWTLRKCKTSALGVRPTR
jgi:hypothetical protein